MLKYSDKYVRECFTNKSYILTKIKHIGSMGLQVYLIIIND